MAAEGAGGGAGPAPDDPLNWAATLMVQELAEPAGRGLLQCPMCASKRCTRVESLATHCLRHHRAQVAQWADSYVPSRPEGIE